MIAYIWKRILSLFFPEGRIRTHLYALSHEDILQEYGVGGIIETPYAYALLPFRNTITRTLIHDAKYTRNTTAKKLCGNLLYHAVTLVTDSTRPYLLIPIPTTKEHARARGGNHVEHMLLLGRGFTHNTRITYIPTLLTRNGSRTPQAQIKNRVERFLNMRNAFTLTKPNVTKNKDVILVDDVTTTGATFMEATDVLLKAGARSVTCIAIAH